MLVAIVLGVFTLVVLVAAFLASKRWHWGQVLTVVAFYFMSVAFLILAAQTLSARNALQKQVKQNEERLERVSAEVNALENGSRDNAVINRLSQSVSIPDEPDGMPSIGVLAHRMRLEARARGRVWRNAVPVGEVDQQSGEVRVGFPVATPEPSGGDEFAEPAAEAAPVAGRLDLDIGSVVYVFEAASEERAEYLGEFKVTDVDPEGRTALLDPLSQLALDQHSGSRLLSSRGPWTVYETMPADKEGALAGLEEEQLRAALPEATVEEYLRDGTAAVADDPEARRVPLDADGQPILPGSDTEPVSYGYRRLRRDYSYLLSDLEQRHTELYALIESAKVEVARLEEALAGAEKQGDFRRQQLRKLQSDLTNVERDRDAIKNHLETLDMQIERAEQLLQETLRENAQLADRLAKKGPELIPVESSGLDIDAL